MSDYLARRRARHEAATPGPWGTGETPKGLFIGGPHPLTIVAEIVDNEEGDGSYITDARNDEAATLDVLESAARMREVIEAGVGHGDAFAFMSRVLNQAHGVCQALDALEGEREG